MRSIPTGRFAEDESKPLPATTDEVVQDDYTADSYGHTEGASERGEDDAARSSAGTT